MRSRFDSSSATSALPRPLNLLLVGERVRDICPCAAPYEPHDLVERAFADSGPIVSLPIRRHDVAWLVNVSKRGHGPQSYVSRRKEVPKVTAPESAVLKAVVNAVHFADDHLTVGLAALWGEPWYQS